MSRILRKAIIAVAWWHSLRYIETRPVQVEVVFERILHRSPQTNCYPGALVVIAEWCQASQMGKHISWPELLGRQTLQIVTSKIGSRQQSNTVCTSLRAEDDGCGKLTATYACDTLVQGPCEYIAQAAVPVLLHHLQAELPSDEVAT
eukprot:6087197-Amphidinium_carterae.1